MSQSHRNRPRIEFPGSETGRGRRPAGRTFSPRLDGLEPRIVQTVSASLVQGQLLIVATGEDQVTLDHSGTTTFVNGSPAADQAITDGIQIRIDSGAFDTIDVNVLANVKPIKVEGRDHLGEVKIGGKPGVGAQGILAPIDLVDFDFVVGAIEVDDSDNKVGREATIDDLFGVGSVVGLAPARISFTTDGLGLRTFDGGSGGNIFTVRNTSAGSSFFGIPSDSTTYIRSGRGSDTVNVVRTDGFGDVNIDGQAGTDLVFIGNNGSAQDVHGEVQFDNRNGFTTLVVDDSASPFGRSVLSATDSSDQDIQEITGLTPGLIRYFARDTRQVLLLGGSGGNTFTVDGTFKSSSGSTSNTTINSGIGTDTVNILRTNGTLNVNGQSGQDRVNVGRNGLLTGILGKVTLTNSGATDALFLDASGQNTGLNATLFADGPGFEAFFVAPAPVSFNRNDVRSIEINGSGVADSFHIFETPRIFVPVTINAGGGNDSISVGSPTNNLDTILGTVTVNGQGGTDSLFVNDQGSTAAHGYTVTSGSVLRSGPHAVTVNFSGLEFPILSKGALTSNSAPNVKSLSMKPAIQQGQVATVRGTLSDKDKDKALTLTVDWGDGSASSVSKPGTRPFAQSHKFNAPGDYVVRAIWTDSEGESNFKNMTLSVKAKSTPAARVSPSGSVPSGPPVATGLLPADGLPVPSAPAVAKARGFLKR